MAVDFSARPSQRGLEAARELDLGDEVAELLQLAVLDPISQGALTPEALDGVDGRAGVAEPAVEDEVDQLDQPVDGQPDEPLPDSGQVEPDPVSEHVARARRTLSASREAEGGSGGRNRDRQR